MKKSSCVVRNCDSIGSQDPELAFFNFPKDDSVRKKWLEVLSMYDDQLNKRSKVCSKHFKKFDYDVKTFNYTIGGKQSPDPNKKICEWKSLKPEAVPSQNLPQKSTFKIKISKKDNNKEIKVEEVKIKEEKVKPQTKMPKKQPVEILPRPRTQSRRAASKEALKQMQLLLDDEDDTVEIPDDDVVPVEPSPPPPPKKKYKLSHRKSSDGNDRDVIVLKSITNRNAENTLELDCWVEQLEEVQKNRIQKIQEEERQLQEQLDSLLKLNNATVIHKSDLTTAIEVTEYVQNAVTAAQSSQPIILNNNISATPQSYQLVMDPRLGLIVGTVNQTGNTSPSATTAAKVYQGKVQVAQNLQQTRSQNVQQTRTPSIVQTRTQNIQQTRTPSPVPQTGRGMRTRRSTARSLSPVATPSSTTATGQPSRVNLPTRAAAAPSRAAAAAQIKAAAAQHKVAGTVTQAKPAQAQQKLAAAQQRVAVAQPKAVPQSKVTTSTKTLGGKKVTVLTPVPPPTRSTRQLRANDQSQQPVNSRPSESNVEGGLATGGPSGASGSSRKVVVDLTSSSTSGDDTRAAPDSREISFNKLQGKTFPSLVVVARPHLRAQETTNDRPKLDAKVKSVLMHAPTKFTEWLIQQGLVRSEQKCSVHTSTQLKLGMYSDVYKFPYSGGYVWISECCPQRFVSVFSGSLFEGSPHPPMVILKLLYHWSCQTNIQNVTQWVKVNNLYVKGMFTWLRSVCTVALQTHLRQLGGPGVKVEVGVISLGTTSQDGSQRQVKVEVLGILETNSKLIRLRAVEPQADGDRNYKKRFSKILEPIFQWVHPQSILVADLTVDKQTLHNMGFTNVVQSTSNEYGSNKQIMEYLRRIVPRMFQNTLSLLSRQIIQQFLDELVWREWFGMTPLQAFDNMVIHLSQQTRYDTGQTLIVRLNKVAQNPFKNWGIPVDSSSTSKTIDTASIQSTTQQQKKSSRFRKSSVLDGSQKSAQNVGGDTIRPPKSISPDVPEQMVPLENYYYGTIDTYSKTPTIVLNMKCPFCKSLFDNNIQLMNHLFKHAHNVSQDAQLCRYCLTSVPTANDLLKHIASSHPGETKFDNGFVCLICETQYMNPFVLGKHMSKEHCPSELPYQCGTCGYRCSNHKQAIDHFYRTHDNGPTIQCPFCLKSTTVFSSSRNIHQNMNYFIQHLQKHQRKQFARRCGKCNLWFVQKDVLRDHQTRMHVSQRGKSGMVPWLAPRNGVMVPKSKMDKYPSDADMINFETLFFNIEKNLTCKECSASMDMPKHFPSFESCQNPNCQYSTCCTNAMQEHNAKCNKSSNSVADQKLPFEMFCICGHSNKDGNQMARHLAICERKSAYPSRAKAKAATVTHSMLDVLGLVRKPEEGSSSGIKKRSRPEDNTSESNDEINAVEDSPVKTSAEEVTERVKRRKLLEVPTKKHQKSEAKEKKTNQNSHQSDEVQHTDSDSKGRSADSKEGSVTRVDNVEAVDEQPIDIEKPLKNAEETVEEVDILSQSIDKEAEDVSHQEKNMDQQMDDQSEDEKDQSVDGSESSKKGEHALTEKIEEPLIDEIEDSTSKEEIEDATSKEMAEAISKQMKDPTSKDELEDATSKDEVEDALSKEEIEDETFNVTASSQVDNEPSRNQTDESSNDVLVKSPEGLEYDLSEELKDKPSNEMETDTLEDEVCKDTLYDEHKKTSEEVQGVQLKEIDEASEQIGDEQPEDVKDEPSEQLENKVYKHVEEQLDEDDLSKDIDKPSIDTDLFENIESSSKDVGEISNGEIDELPDEDVEQSKDVDDPFKDADESSKNVGEVSKDLQEPSEDVDESSKDGDELGTDSEETCESKTRNYVDTAELKDILEGNNDSAMAQEKEDSGADDPEEECSIQYLKQSIDEHSDGETSPLNDSKIDADIEEKPKDEYVDKDGLVEQIKARAIATEHLSESPKEISFEQSVSKKEQLSDSLSLENHLSASEEQMEMSEELPEKPTTTVTEITSDDIQNLISDVVGEKSNINFDEVQNMDEAPSMETETDLPQRITQVDDISMESTTDCIDNNSEILGSESMAMETD